MFVKFDVDEDGKINRKEIELKFLHDENDERSRTEMKSLFNFAIQILTE